jgi:hypothetical protein
MAGARVRLQQGILAMLAWARPVATTEAHAILGESLYPLFAQMRRSEQLHSLAVLHSLQQAGHAEPALWQAALLHDCGKARAPFRLWGRVLVVLANQAMPVKAEQWAGDADEANLSHWRRPFAIYRHHPAWGAAAAQACGAAPLVIELIAAHQQRRPGPPQSQFDTLLALLQAADDSN